MRLLLDTHTFIWWDNARLPKRVTTQIQRADEVYVSAVTAWEIAIKTALGKLSARGTVADAIDDYGFTRLPVTVEHADAVAGLPAHHRDPFDRLLVVQTRIEELTLVTRDPTFGPYGVSVLWA
ncbi:MAG: type II toxin-antitoxin system VapC family toxin [Deltaproteobacteria bacterium]|nr:type II toxin-antitoxin system VapC family toxin [Deltaproteobacteria bacterium]